MAIPIGTLLVAAGIGGTFAQRVVEGLGWGRRAEGVLTAAQQVARQAAQIETASQGGRAILHAFQNLPGFNVLAGLGGRPDVIPGHIPNTEVLARFLDNVVRPKIADINRMFADYLPRTIQDRVFMETYRQSYTQIFAEECTKIFAATEDAQQAWAAGNGLEFPFPEINILDLGKKLHHNIADTLIHRQEIIVPDWNPSWISSSVHNINDKMYTSITVHPHIVRVVQFTVITAIGLLIIVICYRYYLRFRVQYEKDLAREKQLLAFEEYNGQKIHGFEVRW
jgi:hypothetical protein